MIECNIYSGRKGKIDYQETSNHYWRQNSMHMDANGYPLEECEWLAVETATDNIPYDERVGVMYLN